MHKSIIVALLIALACTGVAQAASRDAVERSEFAALQAQMQAMAQRLDRLEATNAQLQGENAELKAAVVQRETELASVRAQGETVAKQPAPAAQPEIPKDLEWASRIKWRGDFRFRQERVEQDYVANGTVEEGATRDRSRIRARFGFEATITPTVKATMALATGGDDPRGTNQTLTGTANRKDARLDLAFADWRFMEDAHLVLGKQPYPVWRPTATLMLDGDFNPEGGAVRYAQDRYFVNAYGHWLTERYASDPAGNNVDTVVAGLQAGLRFPLLGGETTLASHYYDCGNCQGQSPLYANNANGNTVTVVGTTQVLVYDYDVLDLAAQVGTEIGSLPLAFSAVYARNLAAGVENDTAWALGAMLGQASQKGSWEFGALYQSIDKDALFGQFVDSDFAGGVTDSRGWVLAAGYVPARNVRLATQLFLNSANKDVGPEYDTDRLQLDVNYKF